MTELAVREESHQIARVQDQQSAASVLAQWADDARQAAGIATSLAQTSFVPAAFRGKIPETTAAILAGLELGLPPVAALRSMDVIQGTPALRAHAMRGLVQSHGHTVQLVESDERHCVMQGRRKGEEKWQTVTWTIERATKLGLTSKDQWRKQPQTMLEARATGTICRLIAADVLYAMPYAAEELDGSELPDGSAFAAPRVTVDEILAGRPAVPAPDAIAAPAEPAVAPDPGATCGWCEQPGHFEDDCPQRDESDYDDGTDGGVA